MEPVICKMCKEPIWNFMCVDCIANDAEKALPERFQKDFSDLHKSIVENFYSSYDHTFCLKCRHSNPVAVCPYCYITEVLSLLSGKEPIFVKRLVRLLPFYRHPYSESDSKTITEFRNKKTAHGVCDECGETSESLERMDNGWVCEDCRG